MFVHTHTPTRAHGPTRVDADIRLLCSHSTAIAQGGAARNSKLQRARKCRSLAELGGPSTGSMGDKSSERTRTQRDLMESSYQ